MAGEDQDVVMTEVENIAEPDDTQEKVKDNGTNVAPDVPSTSTLPIQSLSGMDDPNLAYFKANEKILVFHGPLIYEGKILSVPKPKPKEDGTLERTYLIHYSGWNKKWDEFVPQSRVLKYNEDNLRRQKEHKIAYEATLKGTGKRHDGKGVGRPGASVSTPKNPASIGGDSTSVDSPSVDNAEPSTSGSAAEDGSKFVKGKSQSLPATPLAPDAALKKKKLEAHVETEVRFMNKQTVEIPLPDRLKMILCDDFDKVTRQKKLLKLPGRHTVGNFLEIYRGYVAVNYKNRESQFLFIEGIQEFFNMLVGSQLLYPFERQQYGELVEKIEESEVRANNDEKLQPLMMSDFYGPVHLLRLFSKLGSSIAFTTMEEIPLLIFKNYCQNLFSYMVSNEADLFQPKRDYTISLPEYQRNNAPLNEED